MRARVRVPRAPACAALVEADARARAGAPSRGSRRRRRRRRPSRRLRRPPVRGTRGAPAALLAASPAPTLDAAARRDAARFLAATAAASSPETALALSAAPCARARARSSRARARAARWRFSLSARLALGEACRAVTRLASAAETAGISSSSSKSTCSPTVPDADAAASEMLRARVFDLARLAVEAGGEDDVTLCETLLLPAVRQFRDASLAPPERRDASARATLAAFAPVGVGSRFPETVPNGSAEAGLLPPLPPSAASLARLWRERARRRNEGGRTFRQRRRRPRGDARRRRVGHPAGAFARVPESSLGSRGTAPPAGGGLDARAFRRARRARPRVRDARGARRPIPRFFDLLESLLAMRDEAAAAPKAGSSASETTTRSRRFARLARKPLDSASRRRRRRPGRGPIPRRARVRAARAGANRARDGFASVGGPRRRDRRAGSGGGRALARLVDLTVAVLDVASRQTSGSVCLDAVDTAPSSARSRWRGTFRRRLRGPPSGRPQILKTRDARFAEALLSAFPRDARRRRAAGAGRVVGGGVAGAPRTPETAVAAASLASLVDRVAFPAASTGSRRWSTPRSARCAGSRDWIRNRRLPTRF